MRLKSSRSVRVERLGALAFVTDSDERHTEGTTIRVRLLPRYESTLNNFILGACSYLREKIRHPKFDIRVNLPPLSFRLGPRTKLAVRPDYKNRMPDKRLEPVVLEVGRWSNRLSGTAVLLLARNADGRLSHTLDGQQLRFGGRGIDTSLIVSGYESNAISVNGFRMSLKGISKILGTSKDRIAMLFDIDVMGDDSVAYDVARERIIGSSGLLVRQSLRTAILSGLEETGIYDQLEDSTKDVIRVALKNTELGMAAAEAHENWGPKRLGEINDDVLRKVAANLPASPWPQGVHKAIALELGISNRLASDAISELLATGAVTKPAAPEESSKLFDDTTVKPSGREN